MANVGWELDVTYDHRPGPGFRKESNFDIAERVHAVMSQVHDKVRLLEAKASLAVLKEVGHYIENLGLKLDLKRSSVTVSPHGSTAITDVYLTLRDLWSRDNVDAETIKMSVWDVTRRDPKTVTEIQPGVWQAYLVWGG